MSFIEGTRLTKEKHEKQNSPFKHLLKPKAGGISFVLDAMQGHLTTIVDVTIYYPGGTPTMLDYLFGKVGKVYIEIDTTEIGEELSGDYFNDRDYKIFVQKWLTNFWHEKDKKLANIIDKN